MAKDVPDAIILSGPDFYEAHITRLYGGYKRTQNLYGRATYQKDPAQVDAERNDAYIYFSLADRKRPGRFFRWRTWWYAPRLSVRIPSILVLNGVYTTLKKYRIKPTQVLYNVSR